MENLVLNDFPYILSENYKITSVADKNKSLGNLQVNLNRSFHYKFFFIVCFCFFFSGWLNKFNKFANL